MAEIRALVVDDSKVGRLTMLKKLEAIGVQVDLTESGQQALDYLESQRPDLIFMDHMMPEMDGFETTLRIKATPGMRDIPVVMVSGNDEPAFVEQARAAGAIDAIAKPPPPGVLEAILAALPEAGAPAEPAPQTIATAPSAPPPAEALDRAAVHALVEQLLGGTLEPLREELLAELANRLDARLDTQRQTLDAWSREWRELLEKNADEIARLRQGMPDAATLDQQQGALEQRLEQRLTRLEGEAANRESEAVSRVNEAASPRAEFDALRETLAQSVAAQVAELRADLQAGNDKQSIQWREVRDTWQASLDEHTAGIDARLAALEGRLDDGAAGLGRLLEETQAAQAALAQRFEALEQRLAAVEEAESGPDGETLPALVDERISARLMDVQTDFTARLETHQAMPLPDDERERMQAPLLEELAVLRGELANLRGEFAELHAQAEAAGQSQAALQADLTAQGEALRALLDDGRDEQLARFAEQQAQLSASLETQQGRLAGVDEGWMRLDALEEKLASVAMLDVDAAAQRVLEQRIGQMRDAVSSVLQPAYASPPVAAAPTPMEPAATLPAAPLDAGLRDEVAQLQAKVKRLALALALAVGGGVLLVAVGMLLF